MAQYFAPDYELDVRPSNMDNANTREYLDKIRAQVVENLKRCAFAPSVQMTDVPRDPLVEGMDDEADDVLDDLDEDENKDKRYTKRRFDQYIQKDGELSESEDEEENAAHGIRRQPNALKRRNQVNYRLDPADSGPESGMATPQDASSIPDDDMDTTADAKMGDAPEPETDVVGSPSAAAEPPSRAEEASAAEKTDMALDDQDQTAASAPISRQPSPKAQDEDTAMEDVSEAAPEPEKTEQTAATTISGEDQDAEKKSAEETPASEKPDAEPSSPGKAGSPEKEGTEQAEPAPSAMETETSEPAETKEKTPEAPKEEPAAKQAEPEAPKEASKDTTEPQPEEPTKSEE